MDTSISLRLRSFRDGSSTRRIGASPGDHAAKGFSLVEVTLALGICTFCLIAVFGLLPLGLSTNRDTVGQTRAVNIVRAVQSDLLSAPRGTTVSRQFGITLPTGTASTAPQTFFLSENGSTASSVVGTGSIYRVDISFGVANGETAPASILVTWPAQGNKVAGVWPTKLAGSYQVFTALTYR